LTLHDRITLGFCIGIPIGILFTVFIYLKKKDTEELDFTIPVIMSFVFAPASLIFAYFTFLGMRGPLFKHYFYVP